MHSLEKYISNKAKQKYTETRKLPKYDKKLFSVLQCNGYSKKLPFPGKHDKVIFNA